MREIKFRALVAGLMVSACIPIDNKRIIRIDPESRMGSYIEVDAVMQYTGLKDSKGQEEYLDYLIKEQDGTIRKIVDGCSAILFEDVKTGDIKYFWQLQPHEVIGNIYEVAKAA